MLRRTALGYIVRTLTPFGLKSTIDLFLSCRTAIVNLSSIATLMNKGPALRTPAPSLPELAKCRHKGSDAPSHLPVSLTSPHKRSEARQAVRPSRRAHLPFKQSKPPRKHLARDLAVLLDRLNARGAVWVARRTDAQGRLRRPARHTRCRRRPQQDPGFSQPVFHLASDAAFRHPPFHIFPTRDSSRERASAHPAFARPIARPQPPRRPAQRRACGAAHVARLTTSSRRVACRTRKLGSRPRRARTRPASSLWSTD